MFRKEELLKKKEHEMETGIDFHQLYPSRRDTEITFEIEAERQYVNRLKIQRQKIQILYDKYDSLLQEMRKKDCKINQQNKSIDRLESKIKDLELMTPEIQCLRTQNKELLFQNQGLRRQLCSIQNQYQDLMTDARMNSKTNYDQREEVEDLNKQLFEKLKLCQIKLEEKQNKFQKERKSWALKIEELRKQMNIQKANHINEYSIINQELLKASQDIEILQNQLRRMNEEMMFERESKNIIRLQCEDKICKVVGDHKMRVKSYKQEIDDLKYSNELLSDKIKELNLRMEETNKENIQISNLLTDEKRMCEEKVYALKFHNSQEKSMLRQQNLQFESKICKLEKQLEERYRRQKQLINCLKTYEEKEKMKRGIRQIEKSELQRINRLLLLDK